MKLVVEINEDVKDNEEIYPDEPRPATVESTFVLTIGISPLNEDTKSCWELRVTALAVPATSNVAPGVAVWIPTFEDVLIMKEGVTLDKVGRVVFEKRRAETPVSMTKFPVV